MIISCVVGGLGNQLFSYYTGLSVARRLQRRLYTDISLTFGANCRPYILGEFGLGAGINLETPGTKAALIRALDLHSKKAPPHSHHHEPYKVVIERSPSFYCGEIFEEAARARICFLQGYWQSYKYFDDLPTVEFSPLKLATAASARRYEELLAAAQKPEECCVAVHIRRGDMTWHQDFYRLVVYEYYEEAIKRILAEIPRATFFLFCDDWQDPVVSRIESFVGSQGLRADQKGLSDADAFRVMARCANHILANSTFSWWAAYLAERLQSNHRLTIAPHRWHVEEGLTNRDLLPSQWIKI